MDEFERRVWTFDWHRGAARADSWLPKRRLGQGRRGHACFVSRGLGYAAGGAAAGWEGEGMDSLEVLSPSEEEWTAVSALPRRMLGGVAFAWNDSPTLVGGGDDGAAFLRFDPREERWETKGEKRLSGKVSYPVALVAKMSYICA